jgi:hypothetical protein
VTARELTPRIIHDFNSACHDLFAMKETPANKQVGSILPGFQDIQIRDWISIHHGRLTALTFNEFITELKTQFLPPHWEEEQRRLLCQATLQKNADFKNWVRGRQNENIVLKGSKCHFDDDGLHLQLESLIDADLRNRCLNRGIHNIVENAIDPVSKEATASVRLKKWIDEVGKIADERTYDLKRFCEAAEEMARPVKRVALAEPSRKGNTGGTGMSERKTGDKRLPPLTENERALLRGHQGCFKC